MKKLIAVIVVAVAIVGGAYWISSLAKRVPETGAAPAPQATLLARLKGEARGPFIVAEGPNGEYLTDKNGQTLYMTTKDQANASGKISPSCDSACEANWPPYLLGTSEVAPDTSKDSFLSKVNLYKRADGRYQFALGNALLYTYAQDVSPGDMRGSGVSGWVLARP